MKHLIMFFVGTVLFFTLLTVNNLMMIGKVIKTSAYTRNILNIVFVFSIIVDMFYIFVQFCFILTCGVI